jgi:hypothetical protein
MTAHSSAHAININQALTIGACPICTLLKDFQWTLADTVIPQADLRLCNFHGWALARSRGSLSRSTPGETVATVFLEMLKGPLVGKVDSHECVLCRRVLEEEAVHLRELAGKFQSPMFAQWMKSQGALCLEHGRKLKEFLPLRLSSIVDAIQERNRSELQEELEAFREQLRHGIHAGGGLLGRAAEFLVGQRGL